MRFKLKEEETVLADVAANLLRGIEGVGGRLKVTSLRILFEPHAINFQRDPVEIALDQVSAVRVRRTWKVVPNGLLVLTNDGTGYKFVVWRRGWLKRVIDDCLS